MMCTPCKAAGKALSTDLDWAKQLHTMCAQNRSDDERPELISHVEPTQCTCQHSTKSVLRTASDHG